VDDPGMARPKTTYWDFIKVEELLTLQSGIADSDAGLSNDEVRFIVIHQIDELWFKLALRELESVRDLFRGSHVEETSLAQTCSGLNRVSLIFELAANQFKLMETMRTRDYLSFRDKLSPASGFQSAQMREIEILIGLDPDERIHLGYEGSFMDALKGEGGKSSPALDRVQRRLDEDMSVKEAIYSWLYRTPIDGSSPDDPDDESIVTAFLDRFYESDHKAKDELIKHTASAQALTDDDVARLQDRYQKELEGSKSYLTAADVEDPGENYRVRRMRAAILFIESNRELPLLSWPGEIIDGLIALEQSMLIFRQRHARMIERVIGRRVGTGGSSGVDYIDQTALKYRVFKEIWAARTMLLSPAQAPRAVNAEFYGLRSDPD
jgi:tryptophan 2,3-dioxygenase